MASRLPKDPLLAVIGSTGTGKSKLAIELAQRFNGEIINGDAMQMYKGLPIITNKIPEHEREGIPHHLLDFIDLREQPWNVTKFVRESQKIIREIRSRGKLPIVVGGTHFYVHGLLVRDALLGKTSGKDSPAAAEEEESERDGREEFPILSAPTPEIYAKLQEVDPAMASRWHPRDRRKIVRSLEIFLQTGRKASDLYEEKRTIESLARPAHGTPVAEDEDEDAGVQGSHDTSGMRYTPLIFWLDAEDSVLKQRLNARVHDMIANGLLEEAETMADLERSLLIQGVPLDKSKGIWVSIGYKELEPFLGAQRAGKSPEKELKAVQTASIEAIQASTRQYAKVQNRYNRIRLMDAINRAGGKDKLFLLDGSDLQKWSDTVTSTSQSITDAFLNGKDLPRPADLSAFAQSRLTSMEVPENYHESFHARICHVCDKTLMTEKEWQGHLTSRSHRKIVQGKAKRAENEARRKLYRSIPEETADP